MLQTRKFVPAFFIFFVSLAMGLFIKAQGYTTSEGEEFSQKQAKSLKINIISNRNGVGLSQDIDILQAELTKLGHSVNFTEDAFFTPYPKVDINLFVQPAQMYCRTFLPFADKNYLIPNHEWCYFSPEDIANFDVILCKTKEAERIFKPLNANTIFLGFTCKDCYDENIPKNFKSPLHLAGASSQKGTDRLIRTWLDNPQFPSLTLIKHKGKTLYPPMPNLNLIFEYLPPSMLKNFQNQCGLHICPSETEGFGHYISEGMSAGSVVLTTDAPPMNEFITDKRCLVGYDQTAPLNMATNYYVDPIKLEIAIATLLSLSDEELKEIGRKNRELYLENDRLFKKRLAEIFSKEFYFNA